MKRLVYTILFLIYALQAFSQEEDSVLDLKNLPPYVPPVNEVKVSHSSGWFPIPSETYGDYSFGWAFGDNWDFARNLRSTGFVPTTYGFSGINPFSDKELERREAFTNSTNDEYKTTSYTTWEFDGKIAFKDIPFFHRFGFYFMNNVGMLYTKDKTKNFLNYRGEKASFTEGGIVTLDEWFVALKYGLMMPIYGVLFNIDDYSLNTFYYLSVSAIVAVSFESSGEQYMQNMNAKDQLRYSGGRDVYYMYKSHVFETLERFRIYADIGLGWDFIIGPIGINTELFCIYPITSVLEDAWWGQMKAGFRFKFNFK